jgi:1-acyl-sn-glycerol-3-phosphate acyltransferase
MIPPRKSPWLERSFHVYNRRFLRAHFNRIHLDGDLDALQGNGKTPLLLCANHSSWWDLLLGLALIERLPQWDCYAPMDEAQLRRYPFFSRLGIIGVDRGSLRGAREFVRYSRTLLEGRPRALCITPQGEFACNSARPIQFQPGVGFVARELSAFFVSTVVLDYEFWTEKRPEAFISVRPLERITVGPDFDRRAFVHALERKMEIHLDELTALREKRNPELFTSLLSGRGGISPLYDAVRALSARLQGKRFAPQHGDVVTPPWRKIKHREP